MCYYTLSIFLGCGHSTSSPDPIAPCSAVRERWRSETVAEATEEELQVQGLGISTTPTFSEPETAVGSLECEAAGPSNRPPHANDHENDEHAHTPTVTATPAEKPQTQIRRRKPDQALTNLMCTCPARSFHPYRTRKLESSCTDCTHTRNSRLSTLESGNKLHLEDWRWKIKYKSPVPVGGRFSNTTRSSGTGQGGEWGGIGLGLHGGVGEVMGSWVKDWRMKGEEVLKVVKGTVESPGVEGMEMGKLRGSSSEDSKSVGFRGGWSSS
ncbi:hypothetical protein BDV95DRAFT_603688 [Massariosphaeria phaeospora]|uniref:Uncharacterized protein n=1 Tax=Massariosphaeria phaeospora TaxID=100035 RepID=A0A7C8MGN0_9PLEO|nr:hypothetical protein BDV95DRAFT_603688 [Massariosphaeria phaeospora]